MIAGIAKQSQAEPDLCAPVSGTVLLYSKLWEELVRAFGRTQGIRERGGFGVWKRVETKRSLVVSPGAPS